MTSQSPSYPDLSNPPTVKVASSARPHTEPLRELCVLALLVGNGVFLFLGFSRLIFVIDGWGSSFGQRSAAQFGAFVGVSALGLPLLAMFLATHVSPLLRRTHLVLVTVLSELGVSVLFGAITYLGAFAYDLGSARATVEGLLERSVWLGFLVLAVILAVRVFRGLYPTPPPRPAGYPAYAPATYGRPYPGQSLYPHGTYSPGAPGAPGSPGSAGADEHLEAMDPFEDSGWPVVPPPPRPAPLVVDSAGDQTMRVGPPVAASAGDLTQRVPAAPGSPAGPAPAAEPAAAPPQPSAPQQPSAPPQPSAPEQPSATSPTPADAADPVKVDPAGA